MEIAVPCCVGSLAAFAVSQLLTVAFGSTEPAREVRSAPARPGELVRAWAEGIGSVLVGTVLPEHVCGCVAEAVRSVRVRGHGLCAGWSERACVGALALASAAAGVLGALVAWSPIGAVAGLAAPPVFIAARASMREKSKRQRIDAAMPEAFGALAISLSSGLSLAQAMRYVGGHAEEPVRSEFVRVSCAMRCGVPAAEALGELVERLQAPGLELVTLALKVSQRTGAPLKELLSEAAQLVGDRIELKRRLDVKTSQARMSARVVSLMPAGMTVFLSLLSEDFRAGVATVPGAVSLAAALVLNAVAALIIRKIMEVRL